MKLLSNLLSHPNRVFAFVWMVIIGANLSGPMSEDGTIKGMIILASAMYFLLLYYKQLLRLIVFKDCLLVLFIYVVPIALMLLSHHDFEERVYTGRIACALLFLTSLVLASKKGLNDYLLHGTFTIVVIGTVLNLYELFVEHNTWSTAPGRSAGLYINPNISGGALLGYGLVFLSTRLGRIKTVDLILMILVLIGVFATFSRSGILISLVLLSAAILIRAQREDAWRIALAGVGIVLVFILFAGYVFLYLELSPDAALRVESLIATGGVGAYYDGRGYAADNALELVTEDPIFGVGVGTVGQMEEGPHNMFVALLVDYGAIGLMVYLIIIAGLALVALRADRTISAPIWLYLGWLMLFGLASHDLLGEFVTIPLMGFAIARVCIIQSRKSIYAVARRQPDSNHVDQPPVPSPSR